MTTAQHPARASLHSAHPGVHRHTDACFWDLFEARWRCPGRRPVRDDRLMRLPRALVEPRRRPPSPTTPVRLRPDPGVDDGC